MSASIREVAREANVSLSTVSKVLNDNPDAKFTAATRERVFSAARRVGYHPNAIARGLSRRKMDTIGVVMAYDQYSVTNDPYLGPCLDGILHASKQGRQKMMVFMEENWEDALPRLPEYCDGHCDGLLLIIPRTDSRIVSALEERGSIPFVVIGDSPENSSRSFVDVDNTGGAVTAMRHLLNLGHRDIAVFCGNPELRSNQQRLAGYQQALEMEGIVCREDFCFPGSFNISSGYDNLKEMIARFPDPKTRPTAVFCLNDAIARGVCNALEELSLKAPQDLSVIGFDDSRLAVERKPCLSTMRQDIRAVGEASTEGLLKLLKNRAGGSIQKLIPAELVVRETTGPPVF